MFTPPTNDTDDPISFMDQYSSLLSPFNCFEIDEYDIPYYYHDESVLLSAGNSIADQPPAESSNEPISESSKMDVFNGIVEQDNNSRSTDNNDHGSSKHKQILLSRRRSSKGDRHSKIPTAQGLRDRRIRLSLDVAKPFFKLQEMLSYDKPSQIVKWLLIQAKSAIEELKETKKSCLSTNSGGKGASCTSELGEEVVENTICDKTAIDMPKVACRREKAKQTRKNAFNREAKELRKKARERARERTQKKQASLLTDPGTRVDLARPKVSQQEFEEERLPFGIQEDFNANWSQLMSLNYHQEDQTFQIKQMPEYEFHGPTWEPYSYSNM